MKRFRKKYVHLCMLCVVSFLLSCKNDALPKPNAYLRLDYPNSTYTTAKTELPFSFKKNTLAQLNSKTKTAQGINITYPKLKATIYLTYKSIADSNLDSLLMDAQNLTQKHTIKADAISQVVYENPETKVYGMLYEVDGNAASQSQFYATDSINHFVSGSLYFYAKPNFDSIYPAAVYLKKDIKILMETLAWGD